MLEYLKSKFRPITIGDVSARPDLDLAAVEMELDFSIPDPLREILVYFGGAIVFENEVRFRPLQTTGLEDTDGCHGLELLYGVPSNTNGFREKNATYRPQLPDGLVAFAESAGGNLICLERLTVRVIFWHHEATSIEKSTFVIAQSVNDFFDGLSVADGHTEVKSSNIIQGKSFLDF
jgi:hypothetical protein